MNNSFLEWARFLNDDSGAVTTDFVVLTAAICTLGFIVATEVFRGAQNAIDATSDALSSAELAPIGPL